MGFLILILANILFPIIALGWLLVFILSPRRSLLKNLSTELRQRLGLHSKKEIFRNKRTLWFHAASVGEVRSLKKVILEVKKKYPDKLIVVTTLTLTGKIKAEKTLKADYISFAPLDFYPFVLNFIKTFNPSHLFVTETELWPNMFMCCANKKIFISIINGRVSEKSLKIYKLVLPLLKIMTEKVTIACVQTLTDYNRYEKLGLKPDKIIVTGNIKYDIAETRPDKIENIKELLQKLNWNNCKIFVCGSTHPLEEEIIIKTFLDIKKEISNFRLVFAPRHVERKESMLKKFRSLKIALISLSESQSNDKEMLIVDELGWLISLYHRADICFVGGSIEKKGGHNILEPAMLGKAVLFGHYTSNLHEAATALIQGGGGFRVDKRNIKEILLKFLHKPALLNDAGIKAKDVALKFQGATEKTIAAIEKLLAEK